MSIPYEWERKKIKRLNLRVRPDGTVHLSVPWHTTLAFAEAFLAQKAVWVQKARARMLAARKPNTQLLAGDVIFLCGIPHTVSLGQGKQYCAAADGVLCLTVRDPADAAERERVFRRFVHKEAAARLTERVQAIYPLFSPRPPAFPSLSFRWMKSRWGSCTAAENHITLNEKLLFVSPVLADYVIYHEFCHFAHQDHSPAFYRCLSRYCPDYAAARRALAKAPMPHFDI